MGLRGPLVRGALVLMEALWVYALVATIVAATTGTTKPTFLGVLAVVGGAFAISRVLQGAVTSLTTLRILGTTLSLLAFYAIIRVDFFGDFAFWDFTWLDLLINDTSYALSAESGGEVAIAGVPLLVIFWVRGILVGQQSIVFEDVASSFAMGFVIIGGSLVLGSLVDAPPRGVELVAVPYVAVGLMAVGLQHASQATDSFNRELTPSWLLAIAGLIAAMGLIALLFVLIDFSTARDGLELLARGLGWVIGGFLTLLAWPVVKILEGVFWFFEQIVDFLGLGADREAQERTVEGGETEQQEEPRNGSLPDWVASVVRYSIAGLVFVAATIFLALLFQRFQRREEPEEEKESVYTEGRFGADLGNLLGSMFRRRGSSRAALNEPVRRLYFEMLAAAERRGVARQPNDTPLDLAPRLETTFRSQTPVEITVLFDDVRYGEREAPEDEVRRLRGQWEGLQ